MIIWVLQSIFKSFYIWVIVRLLIYKLYIISSYYWISLLVLINAQYWHWACFIRQIKVIMNIPALWIKSLVWNNVCNKLLILQPILNLRVVITHRIIFTHFNSQWILKFLITALYSTKYSDITINTYIWNILAIVCLISVSVISVII